MQIVDLTMDNLTAAAGVLGRVFVDILSKTDLPIRSLRASLNPSLAVDQKDMQGILWRHYWVAMIDEQVVGVVGLMTFDTDGADADWVNWFAVDPGFRGRGIGQALLQKAIDEAQARGKKFIRLWTTDAPNEVPAQTLYERFGFIITKKESYTDGDARYKIYREKELNENY